MRQRSNLDSHSKIVSILNPRYLQLQPGGDLGGGNSIKATSTPQPNSRVPVLPCFLPTLGGAMPRPS